MSAAPDSASAFSQTEAYFSGRRVMILTVEQSGRSSRIFVLKSPQRSVTVMQKSLGGGDAREITFLAELKMRFDIVEDGKNRLTSGASGNEMLLGATILEEYLPHLSAIPSHIMPFLVLITSALKNGSPSVFLQITAGVRAVFFICFILLKKPFSCSISPKTTNTPPLPFAQTDNKSLCSKGGCDV